MKDLESSKMNETLKIVEPSKTNKILKILKSTQTQNIEETRIVHANIEESKIMKDKLNIEETGIIQGKTDH